MSCGYPIRRSTSLLYKNRCLFLLLLTRNTGAFLPRATRAFSNKKSPSQLSTDLRPTSFRRLYGSISTKMTERKRVKRKLSKEENERTSEDVISETLFGLFGTVSGELSHSTIAAASVNLERLIQYNSTSTERETVTKVSTMSYSEYEFAQLAFAAAQAMCSIASDSSVTVAKTRKQTWQALQEAAGLLQKEPTASTTLAVSFVFGALALLANSKDEAKAAASALSSTVSRNKPLVHAGRYVANQVLRAYLIHASYSDTINLSTVTQFAKAFKLSEEQERQHYAELAAKCIRFSLGVDASDTSTVNVHGEDENIRKHKVSGALALACQIRPWPVLSPVLLVEAAIPYDLLHAAEQVCISAHKSAKSSTLDNADTMANPALDEAVCAVETLIDYVMEGRMYRRADNIATNLYEQGGKSRYVWARFYHACDTIARVIQKRKLPIIERQVLRVDKAVEKVRGNLPSTSSNGDLVSGEPTVISVSEEIRSFSLEKLGEAGELDAAYRLATLWGMDYAYDEQAILEAAAARKEQYLQFDEILAGCSLPDLIGSAQELHESFKDFRKCGPFGLDAEWEEDTAGAAILQLANPKQVLLLDIPALSSTEEGVHVLEETVGALLDSREVVVGFSCRQDLSRLRTSPCNRTNHWVSGTTAVVDAQRLVEDAEPKLKNAGLSRVCQHYLGKPLDKAEQCSCWSSRPLSERQRAYAALDAVSCVRVYEKLLS